MVEVSLGEAVVDINLTIGAPSPTVVIMMRELPDEHGCLTYLGAIFPELRKLDIPFTKSLFLAPGPGHGHYRCRFLQLEQDEGKSVPEMEAGLDCLNSVVAASHTIMRLRGPRAESFLVENADTGLVVGIHPESAASFAVEVTLPPVPLDAFVIPVTHSNPDVLAMRVNNPYVIFDGRRLGLTPNQLLACTGRPSAELRQLFEVEASNVRNHLEIEPGRNIPKIAVLMRDESTLCARTIYRGEWHPGLPLTGLITLVVSTGIRSSPWYASDDTDAERVFVSHRENVHVSVQWPTLPQQGAVIRIAARRVVNYFQGAEEVGE